MPARIALGLLAVVVIYLPWFIWRCPSPCPSPCPEGNGAELGVTIELVSRCVVKEPDAHLNRSVDKSNHVRWHNQTSERQTVRLTPEYWPFVETYEEIVVDPQKYSAWYTVAPEGEMGIPRSYQVDPLIPDDCGPGDPGITTDP